MYGALFLTMFLGGLWHGAAWTFVVWGLYHGVLLAGHAACRERGWVPRGRPLAVCCTLLSVMVGWVFFRATWLGEAVQLLGVMGGILQGEGGNLALVASPLAWAVLLLAGIIAAVLPDTWRLAVPRRPIWGAILAFLFLCCTFRFATPSPFLYFQF